VILVLWVERGSDLKVVWRIAYSNKKCENMDIISYWQHSYQVSKQCWCSYSVPLST
jgi:hypothetical protein